MKLSALQQSPNLLLNTLQSAAGTMLADSTSITDKLPQSDFSDTATVTATFGLEICAFSVADSSIYTQGSTYTFVVGGVSRFGAVYQLVPTTMVVVVWTDGGANLAVSDVAAVGRHTGTTLNDSYRINQNQLLIVDTLQKSFSRDDFVHVIVNVNSPSLIAVQEIVAYGALNKVASGEVLDPAVLTPVAITQSSGSYVVEYLLSLAENADVLAALESGQSGFSVVFKNTGTSSAYITSVSSFTRPDATVSIVGPYDFLLTPTAIPALDITQYSGPSGAFYINQNLNTYQNNYPSPITVVEWQLASDNLFTSASLVQFATRQDLVPNSEYLRFISVTDLQGFSIPVGGQTYYLRCRLTNKVGIKSAWSDGVSFVYPTAVEEINVNNISINYVNGTMTVSVNENFTRTAQLSFSVVLQQEAFKYTETAGTLASIPVLIDIGQTTSADINIANYLPYYELDAGVIISKSVASNSVHTEGLNSYPIVQQSVSNDVTQSYTVPQKYIPFVDAGAGDPNNAPTPAMVSALNGTLFEDNTTGELWFKSNISGTYQHVGYKKQRKIDVIGTSITLDTTHSGATLVFDSASPCQINIPLNAAGLANFVEGFTTNYRNKNATPGAITVTVAVGDTLTGAGATTVDSKKVSSLYLETRAFFSAGSEWVTAGDLTP